MIFVCQEKCVWRDRLWKEGEVFEGTNADIDTREKDEKGKYRHPLLNHFKVSTRAIHQDEERERLLLIKQCQTYNIDYREDMSIKELEKTLGVVEDRGIGIDVSKKQKKIELQNKCVEAGIDYDPRWNAENLKRVLDGKEAITTTPKKKRRTRSRGKSTKKIEVVNRKRTKEAGSRNSVPEEGAEETQAAHG